MFHVERLREWLELPLGDAPGTPHEIQGALGRVIEAASTGGRQDAVGPLLLWTLREAAARDPEDFGQFVRSVAASAPGGLRTAIGVIDGKVPETPISRSDNTAQAALLEQLNLTVARAHRVATRYAGRAYAQYIPDLDTFRTLPTLERADIENDMTSVCAAGAAVDFCTATSATTTGRPLLVPHNRSELETLMTFSATAPNGSTLRDRADELFGMTLRLMPSGRLIGAPLGASNSILATYDTNAIQENVWDTWDYIIGQVFVEFPTAEGPRPVETVHATPAFGLILSTKYMIQRGLDPSSSSVKLLLVTGSWIGPTTRRWLEQVWGASVYTTYSCSELVGAAVECGVHAGRYHFSCNVFPEILDANGHHVGPGESGRIHLTGLYPFHQSAVFLRYNIGDWGRWHGHSSCECGESCPTLDMLGRTRDVLAFELRSGRLMHIAPVPTRNALDRFACVPKIPRPQFRLHIIHDDIPRLMVDVECFALAGPAWRQQTRDAMRAAILEEDIMIASMAEQGEMALDVRLFSRSALTQLTSVI